MTAGPEYRRNWLGTVITVIFGLHFLPNLIGKIGAIVADVRGGDFHKASSYIFLVLVIIMTVLNIAILYVYVKALTNPRYLHGVDSVDNLKPYKYYILIMFALGLFELIVGIWMKTQNPDDYKVIATAILTFIIILPDILIYWAWGHKCDAKAVSAKIFMPFLPKA
jgi:glucose-6-phosphate-specific signal transduction histidine kinase